MNSASVRTYWLVLLGAAGLFFGHPNPLVHIPALALGTPFCLYWLGQGAPSRKAAFLRGWLSGLIGLCSTLYWLALPIHEVGGLPYVLAAPCVVLLSMYLACYPALFSLASQGLDRTFARPDDAGFSVRGLLAPLCCGLAYGGLEVTCGTLFTGFPWVSLSTAFVPWSPWVQGASLIGAYALSALLAAGACFLAAACTAVGVARFANILAGLVLLAALPAYGAYRLSFAPPQESGPELSVLMVQGNIDQNQKWVPEFQQHTVQHYIDLSEKALAEAAAKTPPPKVQLVLWPETAMPFYFQSDTLYTDQLRKFALAHNVNLAFGTLGYSRSNGQRSLYNRLQFLSPRGISVGWYDKQHLVPFGEYLPGIVSFEFLQKILQGIDFSSGTVSVPVQIALPVAPPDPLADAPLPPLVNGQPQVMTPDSGISAPDAAPRLSLGALICYEGIFPELAQTRVTHGAEILVTISNDAWFGKTAAPAQHLHLIAMRAVEQARPIVRSTNTGYTAVISPIGRITLQGGLFADQTFIASVRPVAETTLYHSLHPLPEAVLALAALASVCLALFRKRR